MVSDLEGLRGYLMGLRMELAHRVHPRWSYCSMCDPAWIHGSCDRCRDGRLQRKKGDLKCSECGAEYALEMKIK